MMRLLSTRPGALARHTLTASLTFALVAIAGCKGGGASSAKLIPEAATVVGGADLAGLQKSKLWTDHVEGMVKEQGKDVLAAMEGCNLGLDKWKSVTFGMTDAGGSDKIAIVVVAEGLGKKENLECAHGKLKEQDGGEDPWTVKEDGKVLELEKGGMAYVVDDDTVVMAGKDWAEDVAKLTKGEGKSAVDGALADVIGRTDAGKHVWFAGVLPASAGGAAAEQLGATPKDVAGFIDFSSGLELKASLGLASSDEAESVKGKVEALFTAFVKDAAKQQGVSDETLDNVKFGTDGSAFTIEAKASDDDVSKGVAQAKALI
jgi:hypothetical protein